VRRSFLQREPSAFFEIERNEMPERTCGQREACGCCGSSEWKEAHCIGSATVCASCWEEILRSQRKRSPRQQALPGVEQATIHLSPNPKSNP
jgi:hypothetical protein